MKNKLLSILLALCLFCALALPAFAQETESDQVYCFTTQDFSTQEGLQGICITSLPDPSVGTMLLGNRVLMEGDILSADQVAAMTFLPVLTREDAQAVVEFLPIYENRVDTTATMELTIRGKEDKAPVAEDVAIETYKNLPREEKLKVFDPEGKTLTYTVLRQPKRGSVTVAEDGTFTYTPKKNKVGVDSFTYTATAPAGNVSREATVVIQILKPTDGKRYTDTAGMDCQFQAEWMRASGIFAAESIGGEERFQPDKPVSQGEFIAMLVKTLDLKEETGNALPENAPQWLRPYLGAALRSGLISQWPQEESGNFDAAVTGAQAAVAVQSALSLEVKEEVVATFSAAATPDWAMDALAVMHEQGLSLGAEEPLTRGQCAKRLYAVSRLAITAPGMAMIRNNQ